MGQGATVELPPTHLNPSFFFCHTKLLHINICCSLPLYLFSGRSIFYTLCQYFTWYFNLPLAITSTSSVLFMWHNRYIQTVYIHLHTFAFSFLHCLLPIPFSLINSSSVSVITLLTNSILGLDQSGMILLSIILVF